MTPDDQTKRESARIRLLPRVVHARAGVAFAEAAGDSASEAAQALCLFSDSWERLEQAYAKQLNGRPLTAIDRVNLLEFIARLGADVQATRLVDQVPGPEERNDPAEQSKAFELIRDSLRSAHASTALCRHLVIVDQPTLALLLARAIKCVDEGDDPSPGF
ncbi:MAG TPA: hypothetical protein VMU11_02390 [Verrucomicrobiae bacterium]|nr:hypothetical protein [Verrucomicrobiae bacterium]